MNNKTVNLFWTGGWDSTFRLVELVYIKKQVVQPYYIIDHNRNSILHEILAMRDIKKLISDIDISAHSRILPTIFCEISEIKEDQMITDSFVELSKTETIAAQYEWLSRYCKHTQIDDMEICNEKAVHDVDNKTRRLVDSHLDRINADYGTYYRINKSAIGSDIYNIYGNFHFPIFDITKPEMNDIAKESGFKEVLGLTWFCLMPTKVGNACGKCHPCRAVYREGLSWRLSTTAKFRYHVWPTLRKIALGLGLLNKT